MNFHESILNATLQLKETYDEKINESFDKKKKWSKEWNGKKLTLSINKNKDFLDKLKSLGINEIWSDCTYKLDDKRWTPAKFTLENVTFDEMDEFLLLVKKLNIKIAVCGKNLINTTPLVLTKENLKNSRLVFTNLSAEGINDVPEETAHFGDVDTTSQCFLNYPLETASVKKFLLVKQNFQHIVQFHDKVTPESLSEFRKTVDSMPFLLLSDMYQTAK